MNLHNTSLVLKPESLITHGTAYDCEQGHNPIPCITLDELTVFVPDEETAKRGMEAFARLHASFTCGFKPCGTLDCCEFGAVDYVSRVLETTGEAS